MAHHGCCSTAIARVLARVGAFARERRGQVSLVFALSAVAVMTAVGSGFDLSRAYTVRQSLSAAAALTCQYAERPSVVTQNFGSAPASYVTSVQSYLASALAAQKLTVAQTTASPFTFTPGGAGDVRLSATVPTTLMNVAGVTSLPVSASAHCFDVPASAPTPTPSAGNTMLVSEGFEVSACSGTCANFYLPNGKQLSWGGGSISPLNTPSSNAGYVGLNGAQWVIMGYCLETDTAFISTGSAPEGSLYAELDCDNAAGSAGNSSISTRVYVQAGQQYELRYFYKARTADDNYSPGYICGSAASDTSWANDPTYENYSKGSTYTRANSPAHFGARSNQINAYFDPETATGTFPTHVTLDGAQTLGGSSLIDTCVYAADWIERSVNVSVATAGYYWLSFAADGASDSFGGLIDDIRLCLGACAGTVQDNFPSDWVAANHGGVPRTLFEDTFESPVYRADGGGHWGPATWVANPYLIYGTTGTSAGGWPAQPALGWATVPKNQMAIILTAAAQGTQFMELTAQNLNRTVSRPLLLVPGYYMLAYNYISDAIFSAATNMVICGLAATQAYSGYGSGTQAAYWRPSNGSLGQVPNNTNIIGVFMSHAQMASTPIADMNNFNNTTYLNPDGTISATPTVPPASVNLSNYNSAQVNPLLDICSYATAWQARAVYFRIIKPAYYWLTIAALGTASQAGGAIDDVKVTALGGPYMAGAPSSFVTIPVPDPQPLAIENATGDFSFVAESQYK